MVTLDSSFGTNGKVVTATGNLTEAFSLVLQPDGKIVVAGLSDDGFDQDFLVLRYNSNGTLDTSFSSDGQVVTDIDFATDDIGQSVTLQADGKILVGGRSFIGPDDDFAIARYNSDGSLDTSFGSNGTVLTNFDIGFEDDEITSIRVQTDGKIVAAGSASIDFDDDFALARYNSDGSLDSSFGQGGTTTIDFAGDDDDASDLLIQADGKLLLIGDAADGFGDRDFALARLNADGTLDSTFGTGGQVTTDLGGLDDIALSAVVQADGKIVVVGSTDVNFDDDFALVRYNSNGTLDTSFGNGGKVITDFADFDDNAVSVHLQPNGKIIVTGTVGNANDSDFGIARYNADGTLDTSFGTNGTLITDFGKGEVATESILQDGKLTIVGFSGPDPFDNDVALARYVLNQKPTDLGVSSLTIAENQLAGTIVGTLNTVDADSGDGFSYVLVDGAGGTDNAAFEIVGSQLKTKAAFDFETKNSYSLRIKTTDTYGDSFEKELKITVSDVVEVVPPPPQRVVPQQPKPGDPILGDRGNNRLPGTSKDDRIRGLQGNDRLLGRAGNDILIGGLGDDFLKGGVGDDVLKGGQGKDICILQQNGIDTVLAFRQGQDKLKLTGGLSFGSLTLTQQDSDTLVGVGSQVFAIIAQIQPSQLTAADFI